MDSRTEVRSFIQKLNSWREDSQREFTNIVDSYSDSINKSIDDFAEQLSVITGERNELLEKVDNLNVEVREMRAKKTNAQPVTESESDLNKDTLEEVNSSKFDVREAKGRLPDVQPVPESESQHNKDSLKKVNNPKFQPVDTDELVDGKLLIISEDPEQEESVKDEQNVQEESINELIKAECNLAISTGEDLKIDLNNFPIKSEMSEECSALNGEIKDQLELKECVVQKDGLIHRSKSVQKDKKLKCDQCPFGATRKSTLKIHIRRKHEKSRNHVCKDCGYTAAGGQDVV